MKTLARLCILLAAGPFPATCSSRNVDPGVRYVGSKTCAGCHSDIGASYAKSAMARSIVSAERFVLPNEGQLPFKIFDSESGQYFEVTRNHDALWQSQAALDSKGKEIFRQTWKLAYVIGSGDSGIGFLIQRDDYLFEAPLSYYAQKKLWSFSPGYELHNYGFRRPVLAQCVSCHSGRPRPVYASAGLYRDPPFDEAGVGCENCHGPGELHVAERRAARPVKGISDDSIVNPGNLSGWLCDNICMKCHQAGDVRVEQPGKHDEDFRPGTSLGTVVEIFKAPPPRDSNAGNPVLLEHYYSMTLSRCYRASSGKLHCTSCHDPHVQPTEDEAATYYRNRCLTCHASRPCTLALAQRNKTTPPDNCAGCHMPKRAIVTIAHAALTEHRVILKPDEPLPEEAFRSTDPQSGLIRLTAYPGETAKAAPDVLLFRAYARLIHDGHDEFRPRMEDVLDRLSLRRQNDPDVLSALARREVQKRTPEAFAAAAHYLNECVQNEGAAAEDFLLLAQLDSAANKHTDEIAVLRAGMQKYPYSAELTESIAAEYVKLGDYRNGLDVIRCGLELFPDDKALRALEDQIESASLDRLSGGHLP